MKKLLPGDGREILEGADTLVVYSLNPFATATGEPRFHDYLILSSRLVTDPGIKRQVASSIIAGVAEGERPAKCFDPRHGVRVTRAGGAALDLLICFECSQVRAYRGSTESSAATSTTSSAAKAVLDQALAVPSTQAASRGLTER